MTMLPAATDFTGASITEAQFKTAITSLRAFIAELIGTSGSDKVAALTALGAILCDSLDKTGAYTVVAADKGKVINCNGTFNLSLTAAATLGDGFAFSVWNNGSGTITIDPNASELIDGATTKALAAGKLAIVYSDGTKFVTVGGFALADLLAADGTGSGLDADLLDGQQGSYYAPASGANYVPKDVGYGGVGSIGVFSLIAGSCSRGSTVAGSYLSEPGLIATLSLSGTWRNVGGGIPASTGGWSCMQRIS